jgi:hypothetical protein
VLRRLFDVLGVTIMLVVIFFVYTAIRDEQLPARSFPTEAPSTRSKIKTKKKKKKSASNSLYAAARQRSLLRKSRSMPMKASALHFMFNGMPPAFHRCASMPARSICSTPSGCMCSGLTESCRVSISRATNIFPS